MNSDRAASNTVETIIIIALAVFAALALFTFVLRPVQNSADSLGQGIDGGVNAILDSGGTVNANVTDAFSNGGAAMGSPGTR